MTKTMGMRSGRKLEVAEYGDRNGHAVFFFHGLIGSHHQASYIAEYAREQGLRIIAPNRPGVGKSEFIPRKSPLESVDDVEDMATALELGELSLIGISGGTPYALAALHRLRDRVRTATVISGMGPFRLPGSLRGMHRGKRLFLEVGARFPDLAKYRFREWTEHFRKAPNRVLDRLIATWSLPDRILFQRGEIYDLFMKDLHQVFTEGQAPESLSQELTLYANLGFSLAELPSNKCVTLWHGLDDNIVPPSMAWQMAHVIPNCEAHFVRGGHFVAVDIADQIMARLRTLLETPSPASA
jgi:pimeloyl-ACP methyl ester carboxylesterase